MNYSCLCRKKAVFFIFNPCQAAKLLTGLKVNHQSEITHLRGGFRIILAILSLSVIIFIILRVSSNCFIRRFTS